MIIWKLPHTLTVIFDLSKFLVRGFIYAEPDFLPAFGR